MATIKTEVTTPARKASVKQVTVMVCDLCDKIQGPRARFHKCHICGRDFCHKCGTDHWEMGYVCNTCGILYRDKYLQALEIADQDYEEAQSKLYTTWKAESLATPNPRSQSS